MPSFLADAAASPVFWIVLVTILLIAIAAYVVVHRRVELFPPPAPDNSKVLQDWLPTGRIDFAGPSIDPSAADTPANFYLQAEEVRLLISMSGIERREIRWRRATLNEAKRVVSMFHRQLPKSALRVLEKDLLPEAAPVVTEAAPVVTEAAPVVAEDTGAHAAEADTPPGEEQQEPRTP